MAGPVPQRSAVESSNNQAPKQDLCPESYLHTLGRGQMLLSPAAGLVQRTGELVGEVRGAVGSLHGKFSAGFYFSPALLQLFLEVSLLQISWVRAVQQLLDTAASLCAVTRWARPAAWGRTSVPSTGHATAGLLPRQFLVYW